MATATPLPPMPLQQRSSSYSGSVPPTPTWLSTSAASHEPSPTPEAKNSRLGPIMPDTQGSPAVPPDMDTVSGLRLDLAAAIGDETAARTASGYSRGSVGSLFGPPRRKFSSGAPLHDSHDYSILLQSAIDQGLGGQDPGKQSVGNVVFHSRCDFFKLDVDSIQNPCATPIPLDARYSTVTDVPCRYVLPGNPPPSHLPPDQKSPHAPQKL